MSIFNVLIGNVMRRGASEPERIHLCLMILDQHSSIRRTSITVNPGRNGEVTQVSAEKRIKVIDIGNACTFVYILRKTGSA